MYTDTHMVAATKQNMRLALDRILGQIKDRLMDGEFTVVQASVEYGGVGYALLDVYANENAPDMEGRRLSGHWEMNKNSNTTQIAWCMVRQACGV